MTFPSRMNRYITVATFQLPQDAYVLKSKLESEGVKCFLKDELTVQTDNFLSNAIGGVKLQIFAFDFEKAKHILEATGHLKVTREQPSEFDNILDRTSRNIPLVGKLPFTIRWITLLTLLFAIVFIAYFLFIIN